MTDEDINWFEGKYPSWLEGIERSAKAAIDEIHRMTIEAMPNKRMGISCRMGFDLEGLGNLFNAAYDEQAVSAMERLLDKSQYQYNTQIRNCNPYSNIGQHQNLGMQGLLNCNPYANMGMYGRNE